ncbi:hypothetical protein Pla110_17420 [Polystyrenella longa]|uniref:Phage holin family protein n=1 Tax=Polystyrenella longa TaxID=2528007 RepID=A0A518CLB6_9PLAN|nr:phage holin family protein [Polystyrenella longa]QDU80020.1 hypothetical protein Pla110_17420 [Polystyrenella longa]
MSVSNGKRTTHEEPISMRKNIGDLGSDLIALSELQLQLISLDSRAALQKAILPIGLMLLSTGLLVGAFPLALIALTWWLAMATSLTQAAAGGIVAGVAAVLAVILLLVAKKGLQNSTKLLDRSRYELKNNIQWIKRVLSSKTERRDCSDYV